MDFNRHSIHIIDNIVPKLEQDRIENITLYPDDTFTHIPWKWYHDTISPTLHPSTPPGFDAYRGGQFVYNALDHPKLNQINTPLQLPLRLLQEKFNKGIQILKCKANFIFREHHTTSTSLFPIHTDIKPPTPLHVFWTAIYYVNDSDGNTIIFDEDLKVRKVITPKKGRLVLFHGHSLHAGQPPIHSNKRIVINYNFLFPEDHKNLKTL